MARRGIIPCGRNKYISGQNAVVFGSGTIGMTATVAFHYFGMNKVMVCDLSDFRLNLARGLGFETCNISTENFGEKATEYFGIARSLKGKTANIDCWLDAAGKQPILEDFIAKGKIESRFVSVAVNNASRNIDLLGLTYAQQQIIGSGGYMPEDVWDVQRIMTSKRWNLEDIITHEFTLNELEKAIRTASDVTHSGNVVIRMNSNETNFRLPVSRAYLFLLQRVIAQIHAYPIIAIKEASTPNPAPVNKILSDGIIIEKIGLP